jgi:hypothetical protein
MAVDRRFPASLVRLAAALFLAGIAMSIYLEAEAGDWLAGHPITVNLISAFICLNAAIVTLARIVGMFAIRERVYELQAPFKQELKDIKARWRPKDIAYAVAVRARRRAARTAYQFQKGRLTEQYRDGVTQYVQALVDLQDRYCIGSVEIDSRLDEIEERLIALSDTGNGHHREAKQYAEVQQWLDRVEYSISKQYRRSVSRSAAEELDGRPQGFEA